VNEEELQAAAGIWQQWRAGGKIEDHVATAPPRVLIQVREFLATQEPHGWIMVGLGFIENEMLNRFTRQHSND
jgi:hypothetical protein